MNSSTDSDEKTPGDAPDGWVVIGHVRRAHGIRGEVVAAVYSEAPRRYGPGTEMLLLPDGRRFIVERLRPVRDGSLIAFAGVADRNEAERLRGATLAVARERLPQLDADEFRPEDLRGLVVVTPRGTRVGVIADVVLGDAQDRLLIEADDAADFEIPFVQALVPEVDIDGGVVTIDPPSGLLGAGEDPKR